MKEYPMKPIWLILVWLCITGFPGWGQLADNGLVRYGDEWINSDQVYFRVPVAEDGIYRIPRAALEAAGIPVATLGGDRYQLFRLGKEEALYVSSGTGILGGADYLEFYGRKNRGELDRYLFADPTGEMLNPEYSLFTDTTLYFLTWTPATGQPVLRYLTEANDLSGSLPAAEPWVWSVTQQLYNQRAYKIYTKIAGNDIYYSHFEGDGFANVLNNEHQFPVAAPQLNAAGPEARLRVRLITNDNQEGHTVQVAWNGTTVAQDSLRGVQVREYAWPAPAGSLTNTGTLRIKGLNTGNDRSAVALTEVRYPRLPDGGNAAWLDFSLPASAGERLLSWRNINTSSNAVMYEPGSSRRWVLTPEAGQLRALLPAASGERQLVLAGSGAIRTIATLTPAQLTLDVPADANYLILSHPALYRNTSGVNPVQAYADYRASAAGGSYRVAIVDATQLYDRFAYGTARHPFAIRNLIQRLRQRNQPLQFIFIIGKGREYTEIRTSESLATAGPGTEGAMLIPSWGFPASDNLLVAGNDNGVPLYPVGRLAAINGDEVSLYLDKVIAHEANTNAPQTIEGRAWMKRVLHLGGGNAAGEQLLIRSLLEGMGKKLASNAYGAEVLGFYKTSSEPIQVAISNQIFDKINEGASIVTFFGHSSPGTFDFNIDNPENYSNVGKYPLMLSLGCYSGNMFTSFRSIGERFVFYGQKGAVAFGASRGVGFISAFSEYAGVFYEKIGQANYGDGIGKALQVTGQQFAGINSISTSTLVQQFSLHGDPALQLYPRPGPDYTVDSRSVEISPRVITLKQDSFSLSFSILNLGKGIPGKIKVHISQDINGTKEKLAIKEIDAPYFKQQIAVTLPVTATLQVGQSRLYIAVNPEQQLTELPLPQANSNNEAIGSDNLPGIPVFIVDDAVITLYPENYGITTTPEVKLIASTLDLFSPTRGYVLELDTLPDFTSSFKQQTRLQQPGGLLEWQPSAIFTPGKVYYWRVSPDSTDAQIGYRWSTSSFSYLPESGNGQRLADFGQFNEGQAENLEFTPADQTAFVRSFNNIRIKNKVWEANNPPEFIFNGQPFGSPWPWIITAGIQMIVIDTVKNFWFLNPPGGLYGSISNNQIQTVWGYDTRTADGRQAMINFIENVIPPGKFVLLYSAQRTQQSDYTPGDWALDSVAYGKNLFQALEAQGAQQVRLLADRGSVPYVFMFQKGVGPLNEQVAPDRTATINAECSTSFRWREGTFQSPQFGPAQHWSSLRIRQTRSAPPETDSIVVRVWALSTPGGEGVLLTEQINPPETWEMSLGDIDAQQYPYLRVELVYFDNENRTAPQLREIMAQFIPQVETNINPADLFEFHADTLERGDELQLRFALENSTAEGQDSVVIAYKITQAQQLIRAEEQTVSRLNPLSRQEVAYVASTQDLQGPYQLEVAVRQGKPERYLFNNTIQRTFQVTTERQAPVVQVAFDGLEIMDGDLVSAQPVIQISLTDENPYLRLLDTALVQVDLLRPGEGWQRVKWSAEKVEVDPASAAGRNTFRLNWQAVFAQSGEYQLRVLARDVSGNIAGGALLQRRFQVVTERMISNVLNYPNPFVTSTRFLYTLTGDAPPTDFRIRIYTIDGKVVRDLGVEDLGPLRLGRHLTDNAWDGTDEFGDPLANGVYLYRVVARDDTGKSYEIYQDGSGTDRFFREGFGKLVILR